MIENFETNIKISLDKFDEYKRSFEEDESSFKEFYNNNLQYNLPIVRKKGFSTFDELKSLNLKLIDDEVQFIKGVLKSYKHRDNISGLFINIINQFIITMKNRTSCLNCSSIFNFISDPTLKEQYSVLTALKDFSKIEKNIVLIGGNGKGKTSLVNFLKGNDHDVVSVIPAQKNLIYNVCDQSIFKDSTRLQLQEILLRNNFLKNVPADDYSFFQYLNSQFTRLILAMKDEYFYYLKLCQDKQVAKKYEGNFGRCLKIFKILFPDIELDMNNDLNNCLFCEKNGNIYTVNELSDGEKSSLYFIMSVLLASDNGIIIVDEPETYLNPSLTSRLWDLLISEKKLCKFIFVTHSMDFVSSRPDSKIAWIKDFKYPSNWSISFLEDNVEIPREMVTEILGTNKPLVFCEGDNKSSLDYRVYQSILGENYTVIPVNGHKEVVTYTKALNKNQLLNYEVYGIIDGDNWTTSMVEGYKRENIFVLPFNEIEMLLVCDEVLENFMENIYMEDYATRIKSFKDAFWNCFIARKHSIILTSVKANLEDFLSHEKIQSYKSKEEIGEELSKYKEKLDDLYNKKNRELDELIANRDYSQLLKECNLKTEITKGLANQYLDSKYIEKVVQRIKCDDCLKYKLKNKYFNLKEQGME